MSTGDQKGNYSITDKITVYRRFLTVTGRNFAITDRNFAITGEFFESAGSLSQGCLGGMRYWPFFWWDAGLAIFSWRDAGSAVFRRRDAGLGCFSVAGCGIGYPPSRAPLKTTGESFVSNDLQHNRHVSSPSTLRNGFDKFNSSIISPFHQ